MKAQGPPPSSGTVASSGTGGSSGPLLGHRTSVELVGTGEPGAGRQFLGRGCESCRTRGEVARALGIGQVRVIRKARRSGCTNPAERRRPIERNAEVSREESAQDLVCELGDLVRPRRHGRARNDRVDRLENLAAALEQQAGALGVLSNQQAQQALSLYAVQNSSCLQPKGLSIRQGLV